MTPREGNEIIREGNEIIREGNEIIRKGEGFEDYSKLR